MDDRLTWKEHTTYLANKIAKSVGILAKVRKYLGAKTVLGLYYSFVYPLLLYGICLWGNCSQTNLWPIFKLQKRAIRIIGSIKRRDSTNNFYYESKIIKLPDLYYQKVAIIMYKYNLGLLPDVMGHLFVRNASIHGRHTRNASRFRMPMTKSLLGEKFIKKQGVIIWNELLDNIDVNVKIGQFKTQVKNFQLQKYVL